MKKFFTGVCLLTLMFTLAACAAGGTLSPSVISQEENDSSYLVESAGNTSPDTYQVDSTSESAAEVLTANQGIHEQTDDYVWDDALVVPVTLNGNSIEAAGEGLRVDGTALTINAGGTYSLSGGLEDGKITVDAGDEAIVRLILNGVELSSSSGSPLEILSAEKVIIILADGAVNQLSDAEEYNYAETDTDESNAAIYSAADLTITGKGGLVLEGRYNDGIVSKDGLLIAGGEIEVIAVDDGVRGKDYVVIKDTQIKIKAGGDGVRSDNDEATERGYVWIESGNVDITAGRDGIDAATDVIVSGGQIQIVSGGGNTVYLDETTSAKGIKGSASVVIDDGAIHINSADDAIHSNGRITINAGSFELTSGDDGMHADESLTINGGTIRIANSYEGLESAVISINSGEIEINSSDDGINVAGGVDASGTDPGMMPPGNRMRPGAMGGPGQDAFTASSDYYLHVNGGKILINADGDGLDINGGVEMSAGLVLINGPTQNMNGALDYMTGFKITGGVLVAAGSAGMAMAPDQSSSQYSILVNFTSTQPAGTVVHIENNAGENLFTFVPAKAYQSVAFSSPQLAEGETYTIFLGGSANGTQIGGLFVDGTYSVGKEYSSFEITDTVTLLGSAGMMGGPQRRP